MSSLITLVENNCKSCLKCVRNCPTKSITFENNHPTIIEEECIHCGNCYLCCPQSAKEIRSDLEVVKKWLRESQEVIVSVAPSYQVIWPNFSKLKQGLLELGFSAVEETALGAHVVSSEYSRLLSENKMSNIIETCCPTIVRLIETKYPELISSLSPVASPMIVHARMLKKRYPDAKVVFLSPCIAKQDEMSDPRFEGAVDAILSMPELDEWLMDVDAYVDEGNAVEEEIARIYPVSGGIIETINDFCEYKTLAIEGLKRCEAALNSIKNGHLKGYFFEMNACLGGCLGGPYLLAYKDNEWLAQVRINAHCSDNKISYSENELDLSAQYFDKSVQHKEYSEMEIYSVLTSMGKADRSKRLDCGACGYDTCREKAVAVLDGKSDPKHCLPYALENAESISNLIIKHSPNGIIVVDSDHKIKEINPSAISMLHLQNYSVKGFEIEAIIHSDQLKEMLANGIDGVKYFVDEYIEGQYIYEHALIPIEEEKSFVIILMDLTAKRKQQEKLKAIRKETIGSTQKVIDKQMRVVQEIASLLGETTAETKMVLTKLNKAIAHEDDVNE